MISRMSAHQVENDPASGSICPARALAAASGNRFALKGVAAVLMR